MNFKIGQRVVCIKDGEWDLYYDERGPQKGEVVTIRALDNSSGELYFKFMEYINPMNYECDDECVFWSERFRPISERTAESEAFAENLIKQLEKEVETLEWLHK